MANEAINITGQSTTSGNIPFLLYRPTVQNKRQPLMIFLHGADEGSPTGTMPNAGLHNDVTVRSLEDNNHGIFTLTKTADLPGFTDPLTSEVFHFYMMGPQQYYSNAVNRSFGIEWPVVYLQAMLLWAKVNLGNNIDWTRVYVTGLSLGGGGTVTMLMRDEFIKQIAAGIPICSGYGHQTNDATRFMDGHKRLAWGGVPLWMFHAADDTSAPPTNTLKISTEINKYNPLRGNKVWELANGGHVIWDNVYVTGDLVLTLSNGVVCPPRPNIFEWALTHRKQDLGKLPYHPDRTVLTTDPT